MAAGDTDGRERGVLGEWNDERGFGFITPPTGGSRVFAHVSAFPRGQRPCTGREVTYTTVRDERGQRRAAQVRYVGRRPRGRTRRTSTVLAVVAASAFLVLVAALVLLGEVTAWILVADGVLSIVAMAMYSADKAAARQGRWRTSESTLHVVALLGGWPGALVAMVVLRHKTRKQPFRTLFWCTVAANCAVLGWLVFRG